MGGYTAWTLAGMAVAVVVDLVVLRTRLLRTGSFWLTMVVMFAFQIPVDGWLTRAEDTIVRYDPDRTSGIRVFFNTPIEDFGFAFALVLLALSVWRRLGRGAGAPTSPGGAP